MSKKIMLSISTYNRKDILEKMALSLSKIDELDKFDILVIDDKSTEFDKNYLKNIFPFANKIIINEQNLKADANMRNIYEIFFKSKNEYLFHIDSDVLLNKKIFKIINELLQYSEKAVYSLYNSNNHKVIDRKKIGSLDCIEKRALGGVCVLFSRKIIVDILKNVPYIKGDTYDNKWSYYLYSKGIPMYCTERSYVQHIGVVGQNNDGIKSFDIGKNFKTNNLEDLIYLNTHYENMVMSLINENKKFKKKEKKKIIRIKKEIGRFFSKIKRRVR